MKSLAEQIQNAFQKHLFDEQMCDRRRTSVLICCAHSQL
ncbi:hypothetical protein C8D03_3185 [Bosea sp. 124]|nr:hypothetical protein C8D03_3185 [Bosea sp. 124]